jgi:hypothetical protein
MASQPRVACAAVLGLALGLVGCARKPLRDSAGTVIVDGSAPVVDGATDGKAGHDGDDASSSPGFLTIDDMEDHPEIPLRTPSAFVWHSSTSLGLGNWFVSSADGATSDVGRAPIDPPRGASQWAREIRSGDSARAANMWAQLDHPQGGAVDLSGYAGIAFWTRLTGSGGVVDVALDNLSGGGGAYFKSDFTRLPTWEIHVSDQWQQFVLPFGGLSVQPTGVVSIDFVVSGAAGPFDLWIDDLVLVCRAACP